MRTRKRMQRFLSIFLACIMVLNVPISAWAFEDVMVIDAFEDMEIDAEQEAFLSETDGESEGQGGALTEEEILIEDTADKETFSNENEDAGLDSSDDEWVLDGQSSDEFEITDIEEYTSDPGLEAEAVSLALVDELSETSDALYTITVTADTEEGKEAISNMEFYTTGWASETSTSNYTGKLQLDTEYGVTLKTTGNMVFRANDPDYLKNLQAISVTVDGETRTLALRNIGIGSGKATKFGDENAFQYITTYQNNGTHEGKYTIVFKNGSYNMTNAMTDKNITVTYIFDPASFRGVNFTADKVTETVDFEKDVTEYNVSLTDMPEVALTLNGVIESDNITLDGAEVSYTDSKKYTLSRTPAVIKLVINGVTYTINVTNKTTYNVSSLKLYRSKAAYESGENSIEITPAFSSTTLTYDTAKVPDYLSTLYMVGTVTPIPSELVYAYTSNKNDTWTETVVSTETGKFEGVVDFSSNTSVGAYIEENVDSPYRVTVTPYATLKSLQMDGVVNQTFDPDTFNYHSWVNDTTESVSIALEPTNEATSAAIGDTTLEAGKTYTFNNWDENGKIKLEIVLTREGCTTTTYTVEYEKTEDANNVAVTDIALNQKSINISMYNTYPLRASLTPEDATDRTVTWTSSDESIATVDENGKVTGVSPGKATITATAGEVSASCTANIILTPAFKEMKIYTSKEAYENGEEPYAITPEFSEKVYAGYNITAADYVESFYVVGTPSDITAANGYKQGMMVLRSQSYGISWTQVSYDSTKGDFTCDGVYPLDGMIQLFFASNSSNKYQFQIQQYNTLKAMETTGTLNQTFDPDTLDYHSWVKSDAESVSLTLEPTNNATTVSIGNTTLEAGKTYTFDNWDADGKIKLEIVLTRDGCTTTTYTVEYEKQPSADSVPLIETQPLSADYIVGDTTDALSVSAVSDGTLAYQWYANIEDSAQNGTKIDGATEASYTPSADKEGTTYYYCVVTNTSAVDKETVSQTACIVVSPDPTPIVTVKTPGNAISDESYEYAADQGYIYTEDEKASELQIEATTTEGSSLTYQWYRCDKASNWSECTALDGATGTAYTPSTEKNVINSNGIFYVCEVTSTFKGKEYKTYSDAVYVFVKAKPSIPEFTVQPTDADYEIGEVVASVSVNAAAADDGDISYQWYSNTQKSTEGAVLLENQKTATLTFADTATTEADISETYYYCVATNTLQGVTVSTVSDIILIRIRSLTAEIEDVLKGTGTKEDPFQIWTADDYQAVYNFVEKGKSFAGLYLKQMDDVVLSEGWKPIGITLDGTNRVSDVSNLRAFSGYLDGNNKLLTIPEEGLPLLGYVKGAEVHNLNVYGKKIAGYGLVNNLTGVGLSGSAVIIDGVTLKSGSSTLKSGLIGTSVDASINWYAGCSAAFVTTIRNCKVEENVVIGYSGNQSQIGAIAGRISGTIENCESYATVQGVSYVGGIAGTVDNAMKACVVTNCKFGGKVIATGTHAGGIVGGGYDNNSAPNGCAIGIKDCTSTGSVTGSSKVGGILGGDSYLVQPWSECAIATGNSFTGTVSGDSYLGGIVGYIAGLNRYTNISGNTFTTKCGTENGIGYVKYLDTSYENPTVFEGTFVYDSSKGEKAPKDEVTQWCNWHSDCNRTDDPLGKDADKLASSDGKPVIKNLTISGDYKKEYYMGQDFDLTGMEFTATWSNGSITYPAAEDVTVTGFDSAKAGDQEVVISYQGVSATMTVKVRKSMHVTFSLLGDRKHDSDKDGIIHTLQMNNLETWVPETVYYYTDMDTTVHDVLLDAAKQYGFEFGSRSSQYGLYIESVTWKGQTLSELDNGKNSGWMYTVNGIHPNVGVAAKYIEDGDVIILHYTDDYTEEESLIYDQSMADETTETITSLPAAEKLSVSDKAAVQAARAAYEALTAEQKALVSAETLKLLEAAEARIAELEKSQHICNWDAGTVTKAATCTETGIKTYKCACGKTRTEVIAKAAHSYSKWTKVSDATVFAAEVQKHTCSVCGASETKNVGSKLKAVLEVPGKLSSISIKKGNTKSLNVTMENGDSVASVKSSAPKTLKATLDKNGKITLKALKKGSAKLTIKLASKTEKTYNVSVVTGTVKTTKLTVTSVKNNKLTLVKGKTHTLKSEIKPFTSTQKVTYKTSDKKVATVTSSGKIKAVGAGKATITVTSGSKKVKVTVTVPGIAGLKSSVTVKKNKTTTLKPKTYGISEKITYTSSNPKVATVTAAGKVKGIKKGTAKITVQAGTYKYTVTVKVK